MRALGLSHAVVVCMHPPLWRCPSKTPQVVRMPPPAPMRACSCCLAAGMAVGVCWCPLALARVTRTTTQLHSKHCSSSSSSRASAAAQQGLPE